MKLKTSNGIEQFQECAKDFFVNMESGAKTLHKKNWPTCKDSKLAYKYYDFDSYQEAKESSVSFTECEKCFKRV